MSCVVLRSAADLTSENLRKIREGFPPKSSTRHKADSSALRRTKGAITTLASAVKLLREQDLDLNSTAFAKAREVVTILLTWIYEQSPGVDPQISKLHYGFATALLEKDQVCARHSEKFCL